MPLTPASSISVAAFIVIVLAVVVAFLFGTHRAYRADSHTAQRALVNAALGVAVWLGLVSWVVLSGRMTLLPMSGLPFFFGGILLVSVATGLSPLGGRLSANIPLAALVGFHAFRLPLELVLHAWVAQGTIPATMTWSGQNWDIVSGVVALVAAPFANRYPVVAWTANLIGAVLLANVMRVALLSAPVPFGWGVTPPLTLAFHLPYALIGPVCVGGALVGHLVLTRALLRSRAR